MVREPDYQAGQGIPGTVYRVHKVLGAGGMGTVYEVEDTTVGKRYVLKTLHGDLADRQDLAARLGREARALAKLQHPNIVEVYTSGTTGDTRKLPFYVMERLNGSSLREVIELKRNKGERLTVEQACDICIDLLDALDHAHEFGIIHRDVKPDNIFVTKGRDGRALAKLLDFGIIKLAAAVGSNTAQHTGGRFIGTFRYAPPEQILGREVTVRSDLYAAGLVLYEMIAGRGPFDDFTGEMEIGKAHIDVMPPRLSRFVGVDPAVEALVMSALEKDPEARPRDAFTFASGLRDLKRRWAAPPVDPASPTVQALSLRPQSQARPATPFVQVDHAPSDAPPTRIDSPAGMNAPTASANPARVTHTVSLGVLPLGPPQPQATFNAAPLTMASAEPPRVVDRQAETREATPQAAVQPNYDTAPIPLAVLAPSRPGGETFGPHTTEASQRKKSARVGAAIAAVATLVALAGVVGFVVWRQHQTSVSAAAQATTSLTPKAIVSVEATALTPVPATTESDTAPIPTNTLPTTPQATADTAKPKPTSTATTPTHTTTTATPTQHVTTAATTPPPPQPSATATHRRPGSGL